MVRERARRNDDLGSDSGSGGSASLLPNYSSAGEKNKEHNEPEKRYVREGREREDGWLPQLLPQSPLLSECCAESVGGEQT